MGNGTATSRERGSRGFIARLFAVACLGALLGWVLLPTGATGQQYQLPTVPPTTTTAPPAPPPVARLPLLTPFPIVRIVGVATARGARISVFTGFRPQVCKIQQLALVAVASVLVVPPRRASRVDCAESADSVNRS